MTVMTAKTIIFDLYGVLFFLNSRVILQQMGFFNTIKFLLKYRKTPYSKYYEILDKMRLDMPGEFQDTIAYRGNYFPLSFCEWQRGTLSNKKTLGKILDFLSILYSQNYFNSFNEYQMFMRLLKQVFNSKSRIPAMKPNKKLIRYIAALKNKKQYRLLMLTNIDHELLNCLQEAFPEIFTLFDDIIASCKVEMIKPQKEIFEHLLNRHQLAAQDCLFFDDQQENIDMANTLGIKGVLYTKSLDVNSFI